MRTGEEAVDWGRRQITNPSQDWYRLCLMFSRMCFDVDALYPNAGRAWDMAEYRHADRNPMNAPRAALGHFELPSVEDHIVFTLGNGLCLTNDWGDRGKIVVARIADISNSWGPYVGWSEDVNGKRVWTPTAVTPKPDPIEAARARNIALYKSICGDWINDRQIDVLKVRALQKTESPRFADDAQLFAETASAAARRFVTGA